MSWPVLTPAELATAQIDRQRALAAATAAYAGMAWSRVDPNRIALTWAQELPALTAVMTAAQVSAATQAQVYVAHVVAAQGLSPEAEGVLIAAALAGVAADGRELRSLLYRPVIASLLGIRDRGLKPADALRIGHGLLDATIRTEILDAGRAATQVAAATYPAVLGYTRMLRPPSCSRCVLLAGRWYPYSAGFPRHPRCLPAGAVASGPTRLATTRRGHQGELCVIATAGGQQLAITGNHPVLTDRGWLPAHLIQEGDHVVRSAFGQRANALMVPNEYQVPTSVEDLWRTDRMSGRLARMPTAAEDFHGDGSDGEVDVVFADGLLRNNDLAPILEPFGELGFTVGAMAADALNGDGVSELLPDGLLDPADGIVGSAGLSRTLFRGHLLGADNSGHRAVTYGGTLSDEASADYVSADAVAAGERVFACASEILGRDSSCGQSYDAPRWDAPPGPFAMESRSAYAERGQDLLLRLAGKVELDRVVKNDRTHWSGHVYNLMSTEGWYSANGFIVSNCDCFHVPGRIDTVGGLRTDPKAYFWSLSHERQDKVFGKDGAEAIRLGADIGQVVNARRSMYVVGGHRYTRYSSSKRGAYRHGGRRWMPEEIFRRARDRAEAIELLRYYGYIR